MRNVAIIGRETSLNNTIREIINSQHDIDCRILNFSDIQEKDFKRLNSDEVIIIADLTTIHNKPVKRIKQISEACPKAHLIVIHFFTNNEIQEDFLEAGADHFLTSDLDDEELMNALQEVL